MHRKFYASDTIHYPSIGEQAFLMSSGKVSKQGDKLIGRVIAAQEDDKGNVVIEVDTSW